MRASEVSQPSYHHHFQVLPSGSQQQTVNSGISRWKRNWVHPACSLPATAFQWRTPSWSANTLVIIYSWPFPSPAPAAVALLVESGLVEIVETMCSEMLDSLPLPELSLVPLWIELHPCKQHWEMWRKKPNVVKAFEELNPSSPFHLSSTWKQRTPSEQDTYSHFHI